ncbi:TPA: hypothetical protein ACGOZH_001831 [Streptococcus suis]
MKKYKYLLLLLFVSMFVSACSNTSQTSAKNKKYEAEVGFNIQVETDYGLLNGLDTSALIWQLYSDEKKPVLNLSFDITEPSGNSDKENETFSNRYQDGQYIKELNSNVISAKFEDEKKLYDIKEGDVLRIITTIKKSEKYNFDYFTQSESSDEIEVKESGDNVLIISKITVGEQWDSEDEEDFEDEENSDDELEYKTLEEFKTWTLNSLSESEDKVIDFKAEELKLTKDYPIKVLPLFFASYTHTYYDGEITRQTAYTKIPGQAYSSIETGADLSDYDGPLTEDEIDKVKSEGIEEYQKNLDYWFSHVINEFEVVTP